MPRKKEFREHTFYLPQGFQQIIDTVVIQRHNVNASTRDKWRLKYNAVIDYITNQHLTLKSDDFVNINQRILSKMVAASNQTCADILRNLLDAGLLLKDGKMVIAESYVENGQRVYTKEGKSYGYKIKGYQDLSIEKVIMLVSEGNKQRICRNEQKTIFQSGELKLYQQCLNLITIDTEKLPNILNEILENKKVKNVNRIKYQEYLSNYYKQHNIPYGGAFVPGANEVNEPDDKTIIRIERAVSKINARQMIATRPVTNSRVYCELTNLNRELRKAVRIDGKPIIGLDIRNSQPLLATHLFSRYFTENGSDIPADVSAYQKDCERGVFYDEFMQAFQLPSELRTEFKKDFFRQVYFSMLTDKMNPFKRMFIDKYPSIWEAIVDEKGGYNFSRDYNKFAQRLQTVEAIIMFDTVNVSLIQKGIYCYNNFDSLYVNNMEDYNIAKDAVLKAFREIGIVPTINFEPYN